MVYLQVYTAIFQFHSVRFKNWILQKNRSTNKQVLVILVNDRSLNKSKTLKLSISITCNLLSQRRAVTTAERAKTRSD